MTKKYKITGWSISPDGVKGMVKSPVLWGHSCDPNCIVPIAYIRKPKSMDESSFKKVLDAISINMQKQDLIYNYDNKNT